MKYICNKFSNSMTKAEKLLKRFQSGPKDFSYGELLRIMHYFGYSEQQGAGSRVVFTNEGCNEV